MVRPRANWAPRKGDVEVNTRVASATSGQARWRHEPTASVAGRPRGPIRDRHRVPGLERSPDRCPGEHSGGGAGCARYRGLGRGGTDCGADRARGRAPVTRPAADHRRARRRTGEVLGARDARSARRGVGAARRRDHPHRDTAGRQLHPAIRPGRTAHRRGQLRATRGLAAGLSPGASAIRR
jgi:hypothetical protein